MKSRIVIKEIKKEGFEFLRHGGDHDIYIRGSKSKAEAITRKISFRISLFAPPSGFFAPSEPFG